MKINSPASIEAAAAVFNSYGGSWAAARKAGYRDRDGTLVIPRRPPQPEQGPSAQTAPRSASDAG